MLPIRKSGSRRLAGGRADNDSARCDRLALANSTPSAISAESATMRLRKCGEHDRRQGTDAVNRFELLDKGAGIGKRLARGNAEALMHRAVRDADAKAKAAAGDLVDIGGTGREFLGRLRIDRRDRGAEADPLGRQRQPGALRHVAVAARHVDARKTAPLDLAGNVEGLAASPGHGDQDLSRVAAQASAAPAVGVGGGIANTRFRSEPGPGIRRQRNTIKNRVSDYGLLHLQRIYSEVLLKVAGSA